VAWLRQVSTGGKGLVAGVNGNGEIWQ